MTLTEPEVGVSIPDTMLRNVLLPQPDGPTIVTNVFPLISKSSPSRARTVGWFLVGGANSLTTFDAFNTANCSSFLYRSHTPMVLAPKSPTDPRRHLCTDRSILSMMPRSITITTTSTTIPQAISPL